MKNKNDGYSGDTFGKIQVDKSQYFTENVSKSKFIMSYYQCRDVLRLNPKSILIIGVGDGYEAYYFNKFDYFCKRCDY